jgi:hypothetical protein
MTLEQQVCSLELAKRLKELGVKQESLFHWDPIWGVSDVEEWQLLKRVDIPSLYAKTPDENYSAFTVAEFGEMLPMMEENWQNARYKDGKWFITNYVNTIPAAEADTEADARATTLVYLLENKLSTL